MPLDGPADGLADSLVDGNLLIGALPHAERERLIPDLQHVELPVGTVLFEQAEHIENVHFPLTGVVSLITSLSDGTTIEFSTLGNEGTTAVPIFLGAKSWLNGKCISQVPGEALQMPAAAFHRALDTLPSLSNVMARYTQTLLVQVGQAVACNRLHSTEKRCARWLLTTHDRVDADEFPLTQEFLAYMLGVRRASVTVAARALQKAGYIEYKRGHIHITDRLGLESASCECYVVMRQALEDLLRLRTERA